MKNDGRMQVFFALLTLMLVLDFAVIVLDTDTHDTSSLLNCGLMGVLIYLWRKFYMPSNS